MRVIAGKARRLPLAAPQGLGTRPTTDRIKETLFNIIKEDVQGCHFLDLFSGSGGIGIEALSRGAADAVFIEFAREPLRCIRVNLEKTKLAGQAVVLPTEVFRGISKLEKEGRVFDIIYADPPYRKGFEKKLLDVLAQSPLVGCGSLIILESPLDTEPDYVDGSVYEIQRIKTYKTNQHLFLRVRNA